VGIIDQNLPENPILIIDDDSNLTSALDRLLSYDYNVHTANSLTDASRLLLDQEFPVILLDYELKSDIDGVVYSSYINQIYPGSFIIMLTGHQEFDLVKRAINEGSINYFLHKPIDSSALRSVIEEAFEKYKSSKKLSSFLKNPEGLDRAKLLLDDVIRSKIVTDSSSGQCEVTGLVISKGSIPVFSRFYNEEIFQSFTDTLFAGFMSALVMVGDEVFSMSKGVNCLRFNQISIYFKFFQEYQISFIIFTPSDIDENHVDQALSEFTAAIENEVTNDDMFFGYSKQNFSIVEGYLEELHRYL
jgi:response regulator RpfG family c-di-GMP phosphodiesterase